MPNYRVYRSIPWSVQAEVLLQLHPKLQWGGGQSVHTWDPFKTGRHGYGESLKLSVDANRMLIDPWASEPCPDLPVERYLLEKV